MLIINEGRKLYSLAEAYIILYKGFRTFPYFIRKKTKISQPLQERIMLAVTEVNGCLICSYAHANMSLEAGMGMNEIKELLAGEYASVPVDELPAILFAQHYADKRGKPSNDSWKRIIEIYGEEKAKSIIAAIRIIMIGNTFGIAWSSFFNRFKSKPDKRSNVFYEIGMILATFIYMPIAFIHAIFANIFHKKI